MRSCERWISGHVWRRTAALAYERRCRVNAGLRKNRSGTGAVVTMTSIKSSVCSEAK